ncbi:hypothetical protein [Rhizobium sp. NFACC06-2]|uniref:hypothetical protein n=1 Tax=Rhizobium sp. NFACC06-2 TaxID=1566264 RepID=UPI002570B956|nr:hypothetical protein [Rhizobium sp. NFACC06-2]
MIVEDGEARAVLGLTILDLLHQAGLLRLDNSQLVGQLLLAGGGALQFADLMGDHLLRNPVENIERIEGRGNAVEDAFLKFVAGDGLAVAAAGAVEFIDREALLAVRAAIAILA